MSSEEKKAIKKALLVKPKIEPTLNTTDFVSSGVTVINLGCYGRISGAFVKGKVYRIAGKSSSGKTFICRTILAEAAMNPSFDDYELIYDDVERGALMETQKFFGNKLVERLTPPAWSKKHNPIYSKTQLDFYRRVKAKLEAGKKFIWIEDSLDSLVPDKETKMTDGKAKINNYELRRIMEPLQESGSILILISQARTDMRSMFGGLCTSGGDALLYYSTLDIWLTKIGSIKKLYKGKKYPIGIRVKAQIKKNRLSGKDRTVFFPFHEEYGIDDVGANIDFLTNCAHWKRVKGVMECPEFKFEGKREELILHIESLNQQRELQILVGKVWHDIEKNLRMERKPRYQ